MDPRVWVRDNLGETPEDWQDEAWGAIAKGHRRISIRSGHGVGKTYFLARTALWFGSTRGDAKIPLAANTQDQLRDTLWPEIRAAVARMPKAMQAVITVSAERVVWTNGNFIVGRTVNEGNPEGLQGFHAKNLCFPVDEASGIPDIGFDIARGALSTDNAILILTGNPTQPDGFFYRTHHNLRDGWYTMRVNSEDYPRARGHINDIIADYGIGSNQYRVRVLGEFPTEGDDTLISLALVMDAVGRDVSPWLRSRVWGMDVARYGDDRSALAKRWGNIVEDKVIWWHGNDLMESCGRIVKEWNETPDAKKPSSINVDVIGMGAGVVDRLRELRLPVIGVNVGERPVDDTGTFMRRGDELWHDALKWLQSRETCMVKDDLLISELSSRRVKMESSGKIRMEPKDDMKKRGLRSCDIADAFVLTFAGGDYSLGIRQNTATMDYDEFGRGGDNRRAQRVAVM